MENDQLRANPPQNQNDLVAQYTCAICLLVIVEPIKTECNHYFCFFCFEEMKDSNLDHLTLKCPLCRVKLNREKQYEIDTNLDKKIKELFPKEYIEKYKILEYNKKLNSSLFKIRITYGNRHRLIEDDDDEIRNNHEWKMFVKLDGIFDEKKFIEKVEFRLHPTFRDNLIVVENPPYSFARIGWGVFLIPIKIYWKDCLNLEPMEFSHFLCFNRDIKSDVKIIKIDKKIVDEHDLL